MKETLNSRGYSFNYILKYSLIATTISFVIMLLSPILSKFLYELWFAIFIVGVPYYLFITKIKKSEEEIIFHENKIIVSDHVSLPIELIDSYKIMYALRLYFALRITLKNNKTYMYYLPISDKEKINTYFKLNNIKESTSIIDFLIKNYLILYILLYFFLLGSFYYLGQQIYYFIVSTNRGFMAIPEVGDQVMVAFQHNLPDRPFVMGGMFHGKVGVGGGPSNNVYCGTFK